MISIQIKERICPLHRQPQVLMCMVCQKTPLLCASCVHSAHSSHVKDVYSMDRLFRQFRQLVEKSVNQSLRQKQEGSLHKLIRERRQQVDRFYNQLAQFTNMTLMEERKRLHHHLDSLQNELAQQQANCASKLQQKKNSLHYLIPYAQDQQLLQIKIKTSSLEAITNFKKTINLLKQKLTNQPTNLEKFETKFKQQFDKSFLFEFNKFIRSKPQPIVQNQAYWPLKNRSNSCGQKRSNSFSSGVTKASMQ